MYRFYLMLMCVDERIFLDERIGIIVKYALCGMNVFECINETNLCVVEL